MVPYHTFDPIRINTDFASLWTKADSFHCVDNEHQTNLDLLADMVRSGSHIYIMLRRHDGNQEGPMGLLHPKIYFFEYKDGSQKLLVGSHNFTTRAVAGINVEASLLVDLQKTDKLSQDVSSFLEKIKHDCEIFDPNKIEEYRRLQKGHSDHTKSVITFYSTKDLSLVGEVITLFGSMTQEFEQMNEVGGNAVVRILRDTGKNTHEVYKAKILDRGYLEQANKRAGGLSYDARFHAYRRSETAPEILPKSIPNPIEVRNSGYFITFEVLERLPDSTIFRKPGSPKDRMVEDDSFLAKESFLLADVVKPKILKPGNKVDFPERIETVEAALSKKMQLIERLVVKY